MSLRERFHSVLDVYSRRQQGSSRRAEALSESFRERLLLFYRDLVNGSFDDFESGYYDVQQYRSQFWQQIHNALQQAYGRFHLSENVVRNVDEDLNVFLSNCSADELFDFVELSFQQDATWALMSAPHSHTDRFVEVVEAINTIFKIEDVPYRLTTLGWRGRYPAMYSGSYAEQSRHYLSQVATYPVVVRADEPILHEQAVQPAMTALSDPRFGVASAEFTEAVIDYRHGRYGDCITKCSSSLESVLQVICQANRWPHGKNDTLEPLLNRVIDSSGLPPFLKEPMKLIGTMRNRLSPSHGGGTTKRSPDEDYARYAITATGSVIVFLVRKTLS